MVALWYCISALMMNDDGDGDDAHENRSCYRCGDDAHENRSCCHCDDDARENRNCYRCESDDAVRLNHQYHLLYKCCFQFQKSFLHPPSVYLITF